jgi:hypothetical protein
MGMPYMRSITNTSGAAKLPDHLGNQHQVQTFHIATQLRGIGGFANQVELIMQMLIELSHHFTRLKTFAVTGDSLLKPDAPYCA